MGHIVLQLTRLGGPVFALNPDLIERAEATPDTVVTLVNGSKYVIRESLDDLAGLILAYRAQVIAAAHISADVPPAAKPGRKDHSHLGSVVALHPGDS
jgi:flagellar protein FlbD